MLNMLLLSALVFLISLDSVRARPNFIIMLMDDVSKGSDTLQSFLSKVGFDTDFRKKSCPCVMNTFAVFLLSKWTFTWKFSSKEEKLRKFSYSFTIFILCKGSDTLESFFSKVAFKSHLRKKLARIEHVLIVKVSFERIKTAKVFMTHVQDFFRKSLLFWLLLLIGMTMPVVVYPLKDIATYLSRSISQMYNLKCSKPTGSCKSSNGTYLTASGQPG